MMYEAHITIEPVEGAALDTFGWICKRRAFKPAHLVMVKDRKITDERSDRDSFATGHGMTYSQIYDRAVALVQDLREAGFKVWRLKIESILFDEDYRPGLPSGEPRVSAACSQLAEV